VFFKGLCGPDTRLVNSYGLTEATIDSTWFEPASLDELLPGRFVPIGRALDNTRVYILDAALEPQPIGIPGELCVGGVAVARGYLNRPELTAERFVPDPFSPDPGTERFPALLYRTGDLARWLPDGTIDFLGRTDRQIKIRGFRIEPGEIESVLERRAEIRAAAVTDRTDPRGETRLVAYIDAAGTAPDAGDLRAYLSEHVPNYMVPSAFVFVDELPYTPNGKVDLDALPDPEWEQAGAAEEFVAPSTDTERRIAEVWSGVLSVSEVGLRDNFFALGGHSLLAMQVMSRLRDEFGVALTLRAIFDAPTVGELAGEVDRALAAPVVPQAPALVRLRRAGMRS
jgi:acyl carrier protein